MTLALKVLLPLPLPAFSYLPPYGQKPPEAGMRVVVPWQAGVRIGIVCAHEELKGHAALELKEAVGTLDDGPWLLPEALAAIEKTAAYTFSPPGLVLANLLATGLSESLEHEVQAVEGVGGIALAKWTKAAAVKPALLELYRRQGLIRERVGRIAPQRRVLVALKPADEALIGPRQASQRAALEALWSLGGADTGVESAAELCRAAFVPESAVRSLVKKGYAGYERRRAPPPPLPVYEPVALAKSVPAPRTQGPQLLVGGSRQGRLAALGGQLRAELEEGNSVLVLVPEGASLRETAAALASLVPVATLSGDLSEAQRNHLWARLQAGEPTVLVGTYLALLAPLAGLARVVVLEEASPSYKLTSGCRVFIPTAARFLAEAKGAAIVLADVSPSPESLVLAATNVWALPRRLPRAHVVNLEGSSNWPLSADLIRVLKQVGERARQAVLLTPRRGFSASLQCPECGWVAMCPNCALPLRYHQEQFALRCHQCGHVERAPAACASCGGATVSPRGPGTQWIVKEVTRLLPETPVYRYDSDRREDLSALLKGEAGVVVATSAIFRHPPLPNLALIAVTLLDTSLNGGDFRSDELSYRLLHNLPEISSQARPLIVLQTFQPGAPALAAFCGQEDSVAYTRKLLERRERYGYPPYRSLAHVQLAAKEEAVARRAAEWLGKALRTRGGGEEEILGPAPAPVERLRGLYCYHLVVRALSHARLEHLLQPALSYRGAARLRVDIDPRDLGALLD